MAVELPFVEALLGKTVSYAWIGHGSAIFLEFGSLSHAKRRDGTPSRHPSGDITLMIQWSWRVERARSIYVGSWSSRRRWDNALKALIGGAVTGVKFTSGLPEISIQLSNGLRMVSFMTAEGQPEWALITRRPLLGSLHVRRGRLCVEAEKPEP